MFTNTTVSHLSQVRDPYLPELNPSGCCFISLSIAQGHTQVKCHMTKCLNDEMWCCYTTNCGLNFIVRPTCPPHTTTSPLPSPPSLKQKIKPSSLSLSSMMELRSSWKVERRQQPGIKHQTHGPAVARLKLKGFLSSGTCREFKFSCRGAAGTQNSRDNKDSSPLIDRCHLIGGNPGVCLTAAALREAAAGSCGCLDLMSRIDVLMHPNAQIHDSPNGLASIP